MFEFLGSEFGFLLMIASFFGAAVLSFLLQKSNKLANIIPGVFSLAGSVFGIIFSGSILLGKEALSFVIAPSTFPALAFSLSVDTLSAFFIFTISLISFACSVYALGYVKHYYGKYNIGLLGVLYNILVIGLILLVSASHALFFLTAWEVMAIASYFLVVYERKNTDNIKAGFLYFTMTYMGTAMILFGFLLIFKYTGSFDFETIRQNAALIPPLVKDIIFILMLIGFGTKAGIIPFHIWLPSAHSATPSHISALMSGVIIKVGIYMMIRVFLDLLQPIPTWWGVVVLVLGSISALLGVLYAITEHDIKKLLAYHSIENIGIILLGLGTAMIFFSLSLPALALFALIAALFHTLNHAIFKSLLFFSAGSVVSQTHTRNMEEYGGLIKHMPHTAFFFLIGSMAISALPPFNGFFSEWITFQSLFHGIMMTDESMKWVFISAAGALAFTGGLALFCFVKVFGAVFLARPRSSEVLHAKESSSSLLVGMGVLAVISLLLGLFSGYVVSLLEKVGGGFGAFKNISSVPTVSTGENLISTGSFSSVSASYVVLFFVIAFLLTLFFQKLFVNRDQKVKEGTTWDCGTDLTPRMEITSTGFARSIILIFRGLLKPSIQKEVKYNDALSRYLPKSRTITLGVRDVYHIYFYSPIGTAVDKVSVYLKKIQSGNINTYILYIFLALMVALYSIL